MVWAVFFNFINLSSRTQLTITREKIERLANNISLYPNNIMSDKKRGGLEQ